MPGIRQKKQQVKGIEIEERRAQVFALRKNGKSYRDIARTLGINKNTVQRDIEAVLGQLIEETKGEAEKYRQIQIERMHDDLSDLKARLDVDPDREDYLATKDRILRVEQMLMKLMGTEELPVQKVESNTVQAIQIDYSGIPDQKQGDA